MKLFLALTAFIIALTAPAGAATFQAQRGISLARTDYTRETPMPWITTWKALDPSLESIGFVDVFDLEPHE